MSTAAEFTHLVITRFNAAVDYASSGHGLDSDWLDERFELFERYCLPSLARQRVAFEWLVLMDAQTPQRYRRRIEAHAADGLLRPVFVDGALTDRRIAEIAGARIGKTANCLVTTRIDNDDAVADGFLLHIQSKVRLRREFLNFALGYQLFEKHLYLWFDPSGPFLTFVEPLDRDCSPTTVYCGPHETLGAVAPIRQLYARPNWIQVVHATNLDNGLAGIRLPFRHSPKNFPDLGLLSEGSATERYRDALRSVRSVGLRVWRRRSAVARRLSAALGRK
jgi:hypothetical protein